MHLYLLFLCFFLLATNNLFSERLAVDSFDNNKVETLPKNWHGRTKKAKLYYTIKEENGKRFLQAHTKNSDDFIIKKVNVDIVKYPYLNWAWRANTLPPGGNESIKSKCDAPASIMVVLSADKTMGVPTPKTLKYTWSSTLPVGTVTSSPYAVWPSQVDIVVLQSGAAKKGRWVTEKRNVLEDYKRFYKKKNVESYVIDAIVIMSDSDNTRSVSAADYDSIYFSSN